MSHKPFGSLPEKYLRKGFVAKLIEINSDKEFVTMNKIGGSKPLLYVNESWPTDKNGHHMTFICQFKHPIEKIYVRLFLNLEDLDEYKFDIIDLNQPYQINPIIPPGVKIIKCKQISSWQKITELVDVEMLYEYYIDHIDQFMLDFSQKLKEEYELTELKEESFSRSIILGILNDEYIFSNKKASAPTLKIGGVPYSELDLTETYIDSGTLFQLSSTKEIEFPFIVGHLMIDDLNFMSELPAEN